jgi:hypothetical protein
MKLRLRNLAEVHFEGNLVSIGFLEAAYAIPGRALSISTRFRPNDLARYRARSAR